MRKFLLPLALVIAAIPVAAQTNNLSDAQQQAIEKLVPYVEPAMVRSLNRYLGPQQGDVFEYNAEMKIDGKSIVIEQNLVSWEKKEDVFDAVHGEWQVKITSTSRNYVKNMPFILETGLTGFYKWFAGVAGYSGFETIDILRNKADERSEVFPNSYFLQESLTPQTITSLNNSLDKYDIMSMDNRSIVVYLMVPAKEYDGDLAVGEKIPEAAAIAVVYGLNLEVTVYNAGVPKTKKTLSYSYNELLKTL